MICCDCAIFDEAPQEAERARELREQARRHCRDEGHTVAIDDVERTLVYESHKQAVLCESWDWRDEAETRR